MFTRMSRHRFTHQWIGLILVTLTSIGCVAPAAAPTPVPPMGTQTSVPPVSTSTLITPSASPTAVSLNTTPTSVPPTNTPTPDFTLASSITDIAGVWQSQAKGLYFRFFEDGILHQAHSLDSLDTEPYAICEIWFEGTQMYLKEKAVSGVPSCGDDPAIYEVHLLLGGHIQIVKVQDKCPPRAGDTALKLDPVR